MEPCNSVPNSLEAVQALMLYDGSTTTQYFWGKRRTLRRVCFYVSSLQAMFDNQHACNTASSAAHINRLCRAGHPSAAQPCTVRRPESPSVRLSARTWLWNVMSSAEVASASARASTALSIAPVS